MKKYLISIAVSFFVLLLSLAYAKEETLLHFVQISDTHLRLDIDKDSHRLHKSSKKLLKTLVKQINEIKDLDFVLATGDNVDIPTEKHLEKFLEITMSLKYPLYVTLGNHDVGVDAEVNKKNYIKKFYAQNSPKSFTNKKTYYSFSPNESFTIICLDGTTEKALTSNGNIDKKQLKWLEGELEKNKEKFVFIAMHFPLVEPFKSESHKFLEPARTKILDMLNKYPNVIGVFTGHYHAARLTKIKNKIHASCPAIIQYPVAFREVIISKDEEGKYLNLDFKWHEVGEPELIEISKKATNGYALLEGAPEDREGIIKIKIY